MTTWQRLSAVLYDPFFWLAERAGLAARRRALVQRAHGRVLEIGADLPVETELERWFPLWDIPI